uniref:Uncharacterized protein n=1 Tax=Proboscia inermis TaxID=420281 RepID=A0A7S0CLD2_9STRA|mmetsp:Transcript_7980/g.8186  ORF Transcript_7980/g.8186 Transcript_7980/m.8186 type:complete len:127 (+) Transcript_7980:274-654(+)
MMPPRSQSRRCIGLALFSPILEDPVKMVTGNLVSSVGIGIEIVMLVTGVVVAVRSLFGGNGRGSYRVNSGTSSPLSLSGVSISFGRNTNSFGEKEPDVIDAVSDAVADPPSTDNMTPAVKGDDRVK